VAGSAELSAVQKRFVEEYCLDFNAKKAAERCGYTSGESAYKQGWRMSRNVHVAAAIRAKLDEIKDGTKLSEVRSDVELARLAFVNIGDICKWTSDTLTLLPSDELGQDELAAISEITFTPGKYGRTVRLKMYDKLAAIRLVLQRLGLLKDKAALDELLDALPPDFARAVRKALAKQLSERAGVADSDNGAGEGDKSGTGQV
jgi:phage terminase small subunit